MPIAATIDLLHQARTSGYGVPAFNVIGLEHAEAIVAGAVDSRAPVILQLSANTVAYHQGAIEPIGRACAELARAAPVPVALHLDHATSETLCQRGVAVGFSSVMLEEDDPALIAGLVAWAHERGVAVEAALGAVGGKDGLVTTVEGLTDPGAAAAFVAATGADSLAVAVGTTHAMRVQTATIDLDRLERIRRAVAVPLVLHGSSGVSDADLRAAIEAGVVKINLATQLNLAFTAAVRQRLTDTEIVDPRRYLSAGRDAIQALVADRLRLVGAAGRA